MLKAMLGGVQYAAKKWNYGLLKSFGLFVPEARAVLAVAKTATKIAKTTTRGLSLSLGLNNGPKGPTGNP